MVVLALVISGRVIFQFMPSIEGDTVYGQVRMPAGVPAYLTEQAADLIEEKALELRTELNEELLALKAAEGSQTKESLTVC